LTVQDQTSVASEPMVFSYSGEIDAGDDCVGDILGGIEVGAERIIVDFVNVTFIDSSVIRTLVRAHRRATDVGGWVRVVYTHHVVRRVIEMCGLSEIFPQYATVEAAGRHGRQSGPS
jgi:anti-anti-sigma factor